jgi:muconate cycloisomerase
MSGDRIAAVEVFRVPVPFARRFVLGSGAVGDPGDAAPRGDVVFVKLTTAGGAVGWGEQRAQPSWSHETAESIGLLSPAVSVGFPFAKAAVDIALHDAAGRIAGLPVSALLGGARHAEIPLCSAIGVDAPEVVAARVAESAAYHAYKVKISGDVVADTAAVVAAAEHAGGRPLWLDANQSYRPSSLRRLLAELSTVDTIHCVEQPVPGTDWAGLRRVRAATTLPIAVDEGSFTAADLARTIALDAADLVVVKVCKAGGLRQALKTAAVAQAHGIEILASGLTDCGVGFAAALHLFSLLDLALPAELNGPELLAETYVDGLRIVDAVATVPDGPGLGVEVDEDRIRHEAVPLV